jgi:LPXTG-motif cell wall-anchored protein
MMRASQRGSIVGFLIVGGVLVFLLIGGTYVVRNVLLSDGQETEVAVEQESGDESDRSNENPTDGFEVVPPSEEDTEQPSQQETNGQTEQPSANETTEPQQQEQNDDTAKETNIPVTGYQGGDDGTADAPGTLPQTGIASGFMSALMLGGLAALVVVYHRSRSLRTSL